MEIEICMQFIITAQGYSDPPPPKDKYANAALTQDAVCVPGNRNGNSIQVVPPFSFQFRKRVR